MLTGCMAEKMPCGMFIRRREPAFEREYPTKFSRVSTEWLTWCEDDLGIKILHARNSGEVKIGPQKIPVDGFHE